MAAAFHRTALLESARDATVRQRIDFPVVAEFAVISP
jgi:hypothetical protein